MKKRKGFIINLLFFLCLLGFLYSAWVLLYRQYDLYQSKRSFEDLQEKKEKIDITKPKIPFTHNKEETPSKILPEEKDKAVELTEEEKLAAIQAYITSLQELNPDTVAWISIENTSINYPIMFTPKNPEYYLYRSFEKKHLSSGTPFLDFRTPLDSGDSGIFPIIYGHNMKNATMFGDLESFISNKDYQYYPIVIETMKGQKAYQVFAALKLNELTPTADYFYSAPKLKTKKAYDDFIRFIKKNSIISPSIPVNYGDDVVILSTCSYHDDRGRFAVVGVCPKKEDSKKKEKKKVE